MEVDVLGIDIIAIHLIITRKLMAMHNFVI